MKVFKVPGVDKPANLMTKILSITNVDKIMTFLDMHVEFNLREAYKTGAVEEHPNDIGVILNKMVKPSYTNLVLVIIVPQFISTSVHLPHGLRVRASSQGSMSLYAVDTCKATWFATQCGALLSNATLHS